MEITPETPEKELPDYWEAEEAEKIGKKLIKENHTPRLASAGIIYLFKKKMKHLGTATKRTQKDLLVNEILGVECDFIITINWPSWIVMEDHQKSALIDHELTHCTYTDRKGELVPALREHDLEEFREIVDRHGLWHGGLNSMAEVMVRTTKPPRGE